MKRLVPSVAVFLAGLVLGVGGLRTVESFTLDQETAHLEAKAARLSAELHDREARVLVLEKKLREQSEQIHTQVTQALDEADRVLATQGSVVDRLKQVLASLRKLRVALTATAVN